MSDLGVFEPVLLEVGEDELAVLAAVLPRLRRHVAENWGHDEVGRALVLRFLDESTIRQVGDRYRLDLPRGVVVALERASRFYYRQLVRNTSGSADPADAARSTEMARAVKGVVKAAEAALKGERDAES